MNVGVQMQCLICHLSINGPLIKELLDTSLGLSFVALAA